jgi:hypothetical protein
MVRIGDDQLLQVYDISDKKKIDAKEDEQRYIYGTFGQG